jgi:hypothetical protein
MNAQGEVLSVMEAAMANWMTRRPGTAMLVTPARSTRPIACAAQRLQNSSPNRSPEWLDRPPTGIIGAIERRTAKRVFLESSIDWRRTIIRDLSVPIAGREIIRPKYS